MANNQKLLDKFISHIWLFENILWKFTNLVLYNNKKEKYKRFLYELYLKKDTYDLFPAELDIEKYNKTLNALTTYYEPINDGTSPPK